jgi:hypothetical protein
MLKTRVVIYIHGGVIQQIETPDDPNMLEILIEDDDDKCIYRAGIVDIDEHGWNSYIERMDNKED